MIDLDAARAGRLACACGPEEQSDAPSLDAWRLATAFALAIFAQTIALAALTLSGAYLAPRPELATLPFAASVVGAACASFPASLLLDQLGRRSAFALGASLGAAGGVLAAHAILTRGFPALCVGAFWIGAAQGFAWFYRHAAAGGSRSAFVVLTGGAAGACLAALATSLARQRFGPGADAFLPLLASTANLLALPLLLSLPHAIGGPARIDGKLDGSFVVALLSSSLGWFAMNHAMARTPILLIGCRWGLEGVAGAAGAHLLAMYVPLAAAALWPSAFPVALALPAGLALSAISLVRPWPEANGLIGAFLLAALGWGLLQTSATRLLHQRRRGFPVLGAYDALILAAAVAGALAP